MTGASNSTGTPQSADRELLPMDCSGFANPYHNPQDLKRFFIDRDQLVMDEVELGSGNFGCVKKGVLKTTDTEMCESFFLMCTLISAVVYTFTHVH